MPRKRRKTILERLRASDDPISTLTKTVMNRMLARILRRLGYDLTRRTPRSVGWHRDRIRLLGDPDTIVDVGVANGTPELYAAFPGRRLVLVEPLAGVHSDALDRIKAGRPEVTVMPYAAGSEERQTFIRVDVGQPSRSSVLKRTELTGEGREIRQTPVRIERLDDMLAKIEGPYGIKIDAEGMELEALKGAERTLSETEFVILETSVRPRFEGSYAFHELVAWMAERGFLVTDMLGYGRGDDVGTRYLDLVFKPERETGK